jgi:hypothetical protein
MNKATKNSGLDFEMKNEKLSNCKLPLASFTSFRFDGVLSGILHTAQPLCIYSAQRGHSAVTASHPFAERHVGRYTFGTIQFPPEILPARNTAGKIRQRVWNQFFGELKIY